jgi:hypothetical protein
MPVPAHGLRLCAPEAVHGHPSPSHCAMELVREHHCAIEASACNRTWARVPGPV